MSNQIQYLNQASSEYDSFTLINISIINDKSLLLQFKQKEGVTVSQEKFEFEECESVGLIMTFSAEKLKENLSDLKEHFLNTTIFVDHISETELEFIGDCDLNFEVEKYTEFLFEYESDDWMRKYKMAVESSNNTSLENIEMREKLSEIKSTINAYAGVWPDNKPYHDLIAAIRRKLE